MRNLEKEQRLGRNGIENLCIKPTFNYCTGEEQFTFFKLPKCLIDDACFWGLSIDAKLLYEEEAVAIRMIFDQYVNTDLGANGIAKYLENHGIHKIARQNGKNPLFDAALIRRIIQNPVYSGKISYGRRRTEKVHGTRNEYRQVKKDDYLLVDGLHEALVSEEVWEQAQVKVAAQAKKYEKVNRDKREKIHLLSGILKCPVCGAGMYGNKSIKKRKDGSNYKDFYYYGCKHRNMTRGHKCDYKKQVHEELLDASVAEVISKLVSNPKFSDLIRNKINMEVDTSALDQEIENYKIQLRKLYHNKDTILSDMDSLDYEDKHYQRRKTDLENHLYKTYDKIDDAEELLVSAKAKKRSLLADKITGDNIYKALVFFDKLYAQMNEAEKREFLSQLVDNVQIYEERKENGQWLKSIEFKLPIIEKEFTLSLDNDTQNETVVLLSKGEVDSKKIRVQFSLEDMDMSEFQDGATYPQIKEYVLEHTGLKVSSLYISQVKRKCGLEVGKNYNLPKSVDSKQPQCPPEKEKAIREALKYFQMI